MALGNSTMTYDQLGQLTAHLLHKAFIETTRTVSKGVYRRLVDGETVPITQLEFERDETVQLNMKLHMSEYQGDINYSRFRDGVVALLQELITALSKEGAMKTFQANTGEGESTNTRLMGASGATQHGEDINVLMVAMTPSDREPLVLLELMYMDPRQFVAPNRGES
ncbi:MAG: hypothetical protein ISR31_04545 [Luminiphilus sp.]|nr:hypothetical protein [Luminiphilus sp.]|tara:strand:+ start:74 stop:574 length:501 start_codon:yes stop_codon:yes gene_type:complete